MTEVESFDWHARYNRMPGAGDEELHVTGTCRLRSSSAKAALEPAPIGIVPEPGILSLRLIVTSPAVGDDRMTDREVSWHDKVGSKIEKVRIGGDTKAQIEVTTVE